MNNLKPHPLRLLSKSFMYFIMTLEVVYPATYLYRILPVWHGATSLASLGLLASLAAMPLLHIAAATSDPGFVAPAWAAAAAAAAAAKGSPSSPAKGAGKLAGGAASTAGGDGEIQPADADPDDRAERGASGAAGNRGGVGGAGAGTGGGQEWSGPVCTTCAVPRPMRAKHCPACRRCVRHMDHVSA